MENLETHIESMLERHKYVLTESETNPEIEPNYHIGAIDVLEEILFLIQYNPDENEEG